MPGQRRSRRALGLRSRVLAAAPQAPALLLHRTCHNKEEIKLQHTYWRLISAHVDLQSLLMINLPTS
ncbi:hypothetical protein BDA96_07G086500 [Sorghum bicolor]|uniref:Uncharacterized protein n=1 Tax=Sorghum bicolor TaxID=4558 RepID=A0A921QJF9_SORBI|nr:hypothetical protein BDA96_07G086500 [Sorghum bicolor]